MSWPRCFSTFSRLSWAVSHFRLGRIETHGAADYGLALGPIATYARYFKSSMLETLNQDYVLTAESKGLSRFNVIRKHVLRNSALPSITLLAGRIVGIFTGSFLVERMFSIPGIGFYYISSINNNDYSMILGTTIFYAVLFVIAQLLVDLIYMLVDPRIRVAPEKN